MGNGFVTLPRTWINSGIYYRALGSFIAAEYNRYASTLFESINLTLELVDSITSTLLD